MKLKTKRITKAFLGTLALFVFFSQVVGAQAPSSHSVKFSIYNNYNWAQFCALTNTTYKNSVDAYFSRPSGNPVNEDTIKNYVSENLATFLLGGGYGSKLAVNSSSTSSATRELTVEDSDNIRNCLLVAGPSLQELVGQTPRDQGTGNLGGSSGPVGPCQADASLLSFPTWYKYLNPVGVECEPQIRSIKDVWLVAAALLDIALRLGALLSVGFIIWAGFRFLTSQGDPNTIKESRDTIVNAVIGLVITVIAAVSVDFLAGRF